MPLPIYRTFQALRFRPKKNLFGAWGVPLCFKYFKVPLELEDRLITSAKIARNVFANANLQIGSRGFSGGFG